MTIEWQEIGLRHGTDKAHYHHYMPDYQVLLSGRQVLRLLEIGVMNGDSLRMWEELFPNATVVGVDINQAYEWNATHVMIADATNSAAMHRVNDIYGPFDVIIDDGSHDFQDVEATFKIMFPLMRTGGIYVIEDLNENVLWVQTFAEENGGHIISAHDPTVSSPGSLIWFVAP
jgi:predicted O-methyltransferase YrrM